MRRFWEDSDAGINLKAREKGKKWSWTRENMCQYHMAWAENTPRHFSQFDGKRLGVKKKEKKARIWAERSKMECAWEELERGRISISIGLKTSPADRDGNRQMEDEKRSIWILLDLCVNAASQTQRTTAKKNGGMKKRREFKAGETEGLLSPQPCLTRFRKHQWRRETVHIGD